MPEFINITGVAVLSCTTAAAALAALYRLAPKLKLMDYPNRRKVHGNPKPQVGGLGIILAVSLCSPFFMSSSNVTGVYAAILILTTVGCIDDARILNHWWKFAAQLLAAGIMVYSGTMLQSFGDVFGHGAVSLRHAAAPITMFCTVGVVNAVNMIDGLDGLLGGISLIAFISFSFLAFINQQPELMVLSAAFAGALIAFLGYNWRPAKLFMGDAGSLAIGFTLAFLSVAITQKQNSLVTPAAPLLILAVPVVDAVIVIVKRMMKGGNPFSADRNHLHHMLLRFAYSKERAVKVILLIAASTAAIGVAGPALAVREQYLFAAFLVFVALYATGAAYIRDALETYVRAKKGKTGQRKQSLPAAMLLRFMERLRRVRRRYQRRLARLPLICSLQDQSLTGMVLDIGRGGISARLPRAVRTGKTVDASMLLMENDRAVRFAPAMEAVWSQKTEGGYLHGFEFLPLRPDQTAMLKKHMRTVETELSGPHETEGGPPGSAPNFDWWNVAARNVGQEGPEANRGPRHETIEIAGTRCAIIFDQGFFHDGFETMLSHYRKWGFSSQGPADMTITVRNALLPQTEQESGSVFYSATEYDSISASMFFDAAELKGDIGIVVRENDIFTPVRIVELFETYIATVYLLHLLFHGKGTLIHSSGIDDNGEGYIFAGPSGNGKSTIARFSRPRTVLCDDLVVLRKERDDDAGTVYGTPFWGDHDSINRGVPCRALFFIEQSTTDELIPLSRMSAVVELMKEGVIGNLLSLPEIERVFPPSKMLAHLIELLEGIPCYRLRFTKNDTFWEVIHGQQQQISEKARSCMARGRRGSGGAYSGQQAASHIQ